MKAVKYGLMAMALLLATACSSVRHTADVAPVRTEVVSLSVADLEVGKQKVSRSTTWSFQFFKRTDVKTLTNNTEAQLLEEAGADVLVEPQYIVEHYGPFSGGKVTVIGYPATFKNFHKITPAEAEILKTVCPAKSCGNKPQNMRFHFPRF